MWCADITYIRLANGFAYLTAVIDWHGRYVGFFAQTVRNLHLASRVSVPRKEEERQKPAILQSLVVILGEDRVTDDRADASLRAHRNRP